MTAVEWGEEEGSSGTSGPYTCMYVGFLTAWPESRGIMGINDDPSVQACRAEAIMLLNPLNPSPPRQLRHVA